VSGRLAELKTTIDAGLAHWSNVLQTIGFEFEQWNFLVCLGHFTSSFGSLLGIIEVELS
jgi:hypothetical protein